MNHLFRSTSAFSGRSALPYLKSTASTSSWFSSTTSDVDKVFQKIVYLHPLSQIVLEYFQDCRSDWVHQKGLERSLLLHRDGTFELKFPDATITTNISSSSSSSNVDNKKHDDAVNRIWTSYDEQDKKHWLTVQKGPLHERFLLQDNMASAWHTSRQSLPERIQVTVDEMIRAIDRLEGLEQDQQNDDYPK